MKRLLFYYLLKITFSDPVENHRFTLRCVPLSGAQQQISALKIRIQPEESLSSSIDSFGNYCIYGHVISPHTLFQVEVSGIAETGLTSFCPADPEYKMGLYRCQTDYTRPGKNLTSYFQSLSLQETASNYEKSLLLMQALYTHFRYESGATNYRTSAEEAFTLGKGVCQDYAHILLSLCRMAKIPCRYVTGMLIGEGASHAWVEIYDKERWFSLDPTNALIVNQDHIRISAGRDYNDCVINQGLFYGKTFQNQEVKVLVKELREDKNIHD